MASEATVSPALPLSIARELTSDLAQTVPSILNDKLVAEPTSLLAPSDPSESRLLDPQARTHSSTSILSLSTSSSTDSTSSTGSSIFRPSSLQERAAQAQANARAAMWRDHVQEILDKDRRRADEAAEANVLWRTVRRISVII